MFKDAVNLKLTSSPSAYHILFPASQQPLGWAGVSELDHLVSPMNIRFKEESQQAGAVAGERPGKGVHVLGLGRDSYFPLVPGPTHP